MVKNANQFIYYKISVTFFVALLHISQARSFEATIILSEGLDARRSLLYISFVRSFFHYGY